MVVTLGWLGSIIYLINHGYISAVKSWNEKIYYSGNFIAAISLVISSLFLSSYQAVVINSFWALISALLILKYDVAKLAFSKRTFFAGFILILAYLALIAYQHGLRSEALFIVLAWSSSYTFCLSYFLFSSKKISHLNYLLLNTYAACALLPLLYIQQNWPVFTLEVCWALISVYGVYARLDQVHLID